MPSASKNLLLLTAAVLALAGGYWAAQLLRPPPDTAAVIAHGGEMIDFTLPDLEGKPRSIGEWRGRIIVLNFWGTWCPPCIEEVPLLIELQKKRAADGVQVIGVAIDDKGAVVRYHQSAGINYPVLMGDDGTLGLIARYGNRTGSLPYTVIINRQGDIAARKLGAFTRSEIETLLKPLIHPAESSIS